MHETALVNARIVDGTGSPWFAGAIGIADGQIETVSREPSLRAEARETVDLGGLSLAPGFVDTHSHSGLRLFDEPTLPPKIRQGITTEIVGQDGFSMAPMYREEGAKAWETHLSGLDGRTESDWNWGSTAEYLDAVDQRGVAPNVATLVGHGTVRYNVLGMEDRPVRPAEQERMDALVTEALGDGAIGLSTGLVYTPQSNSDTGELRSLASQLSAYRRPLVAHIRSESSDIWTALDECIDIGASEEIPLHLSHFKLIGDAQHGKADRALAILDAARERGVEVTADQYPYTAGATTLASDLPQWTRAGGVEQTLTQLRDEDSRARIREDATVQTKDWDRLVISSVGTEKNTHLEGQSLAEIASERDDDPATVMMDVLLEERLEVSRIHHMLDPTDVETILEDERTAVATDGLLGGCPHPRTYGTYPRVLGNYARDANLFSVEKAVRLMTSLPAQAMGLQRKGLVRPGMDADLVAFDPATIQSRATYESPQTFPDGLPHVIVNGTFVVRDGEVTGKTPGVAVRGSAT